jgi:hypothetical protein
MLISAGIGLHQVQMYIYESATGSIINEIDDETGYQKLPFTYTNNTRQKRNPKKEEINVNRVRNLNNAMLRRITFFGVWFVPNPISKRWIIQLLLLRIFVP